MTQVVGGSANRRYTMEELRALSVRGTTAPITGDPIPSAPIGSEQPPQNPDDLAVQRAVMNARRTDLLIDFWIWRRVIGDAQAAATMVLAMQQRISREMEPPPPDWSGLSDNGTTVETWPFPIRG
jgi:hypothetical protein